jgi:redox-sensing transcriptional repressor
LAGELKSILGLDREWTMALVGVGNLGRAILSYRGFAPQGFRIVSAFDSDPFAESYGGVPVQDVKELRQALRERPVDIGIVAVPAAAAQEVVDALVESGVKAILNYAPISPRVPPGIRLRDIEPVLALQGMTYYLKQVGSPAKTAP